MRSPERLAGVLPRQVAVVGVEPPLVEDGPGEVVEFLGQRRERSPGRTPARRAVTRVVDLNLGTERRVVGEDDRAVVVIGAHVSPFVRSDRSASTSRPDAALRLGEVRDDTRVLAGRVRLISNPPV